MRSTPCVHGLDGKIDQHDRVLGDDAHEHQNADDHGQWSSASSVMSSADDRAGDRQRQREQDGQGMQQAREQDGQHDIDHHQAVAHRGAEFLEQLGLQLGIAALA